MKHHILMLTCAAIVACGGTDETPKTVADVVKAPNSNEVPARPDALPATTADAQACARLREIGCSEGSPKRGKCEDTFSHARTLEPSGNRGAVENVAACVTKATTASAVRACGSANTLTIECANK